MLLASANKDCHGANLEPVVERLLVHRPGKEGSHHGLYEKLSSERSKPKVVLNGFLRKLLRQLLMLGCLSHHLAIWKYMPPIR